MSIQYIVNGVFRALQKSIILFRILYYVRATLFSPFSILISQGSLNIMGGPYRLLVWALGLAGAKLYGILCRNKQ